jgi:mycothiol synthase
LTLPVHHYTADDLPGLLEFVDPSGEGALNTGNLIRRSIFRDTLTLPGRRAERDLLLLVDDGGDLTGFCLALPEPPIGSCILNVAVADPVRNTVDHRLLIQAGIEEARNHDVGEVHVALNPPYADAPALGALGFDVVRIYWNMTWHGGRIDAVEAPDGYRVRDFTDADLTSLTAVQNAAFGGSWGYSPNTEEQVAHRAAMANTCNDGIRLLFHEDELVGYCWTLLIPSAGTLVGVIGTIGVTPAYQGRGVSKVVLVSGMRYLAEAGADHIRLEVDSSNTAGIRLYQSTGFRKTGEIQWHGLRL